MTAERMYDQTSLDDLITGPTPPGFWDDAEVISRYTRGQALEDGVLADVTETAREAGFIFPVAITANVLHDLNNIPIPLAGIESYEGRLWDLLYMAFIRIRAMKKQVTNDTIFQKMYLNRNEGGARKKLYIYKIHVGPGDAGEGVVTIMRRNED